MKRILVIGGTGNVGRQVVRQLAATGAPFRVMTRSPDTATVPPHVEVVRGDLTVPETLDRCLQGVHTVFLVWVAPPDAVAQAVAMSSAEVALSSANVRDDASRRWVDTTRWSRARVQAT